MTPAAFRVAVMEDGVLEQDADAAMLQMIQIVIGTARMPVRDSNNNLIAQVHAVGEGAKALVAFGAKQVELTPEKIAQFSNITTSPEHDVFVISEADSRLPDMSKSIEQLKALGYPVFIFNEDAIRQIFGDKVDIHAAIFRLVELAAVLGKTQFSLLMRDYGIPPQVGGYFSVAVCLKGVIKTLIAEFVAQQSVAQAA
jgi:hypothetical protein